MSSTKGLYKLTASIFAIGAISFPMAFSNFNIDNNLSKDIEARNTSTNDYQIIPTNDFIDIVDSFEKDWSTNPGTNIDFDKYLENTLQDNPFSFYYEWSNLFPGDNYTRIFSIEENEDVSFLLEDYAENFIYFITEESPDEIKISISDFKDSKAQNYTIGDIIWTLFAGNVNPELSSKNLINSNETSFNNHPLDSAVQPQDEDEVLAKSNYYWDPAKIDDFKIVYSDGSNPYYEVELIDRKMNKLTDAYTPIFTVGNTYEGDILDDLSNPTPEQIAVWLIRSAHADKNIPTDDFSYTINLLEERIDANNEYRKYDVVDKMNNTYDRYVVESNYGKYSLYSDFDITAEPFVPPTSPIINNIDADDVVNNPWKRADLSDPTIETEMRTHIQELIPLQEEKLDLTDPLVALQGVMEQPLENLYYEYTGIEFDESLGSVYDQNLFTLTINEAPVQKGNKTTFDIKFEANVDDNRGKPIIFGTIDNLILTVKSSMFTITDLITYGIAGSAAISIITFSTIWFVTWRRYKKAISIPIDAIL